MIIYKLQLTFITSTWYAVILAATVCRQSELTVGPRGLASFDGFRVWHMLVDREGGGGVGEAGEANYVLALSALAPVQHKDERMKWK